MKTRILLIINLVVMLITTTIMMLNTNYNMGKDIFFLVIFVAFIINILLIFLNINKLKIICIMLFWVFAFIVPAYKVSYTVAPTGPNSELMGLALQCKYVNIYGIETFNAKY